MLRNWLVVASLGASSSLHVAPRHCAARRAGAPVCVAAGIISDIMTPVADAVVLDPEMSLSEAANMLNARKITGAPVVEGGKLIGVLSQFDFLFKAAGGAGMDLTSPTYRADIKKILGGTVRSAMTSDPTTVGPGDTVQSVAAVMIRRRFNHVPVVGDGGEVVGILRSTDVMRHVLSTIS